MGTIISVISAEKRPTAAIRCALASAIAAFTVAFASSPVCAQAIGNPEATVVPELVVTARRPGPAWWKVTKGDSTVYVLALPLGPWPKGMAWDRTVLRRRLRDARLLILPPTFTANLGDLFSFLRMRSAVRAKTPLQSRLPPELFSRYQAALAQAGQPSSRYDGWDVSLAGQILRVDVLKHYGLDDMTVQKQAISEANGLRLKRRALTYRAVTELKTILNQRSQDKGLACFEGDLQDIEVGPVRYRAAAAAWARGDGAGALNLPHGVEVCADLLADNLMQRSNQDIAAAITDALAAPGVSVALVPVRRLVVRNGVIERLRAQGLTVSDPASLTN